MEPSDNSSEVNASDSNLVLVCGLGSLGQYSVATLQAFGVAVSAIDLTEPTFWEVPELPRILEQLLIADCRQISTLERAGIHRCRAVLLVTGNERVNLESAFAVRSLNARARIVVRSSKQNFNSLLAQQLGNFIAYEATEVTAPAFATAAMGGEMTGWFEVSDQPFIVIKRTVVEGDAWCSRRSIGELNASFRRVLAHLSPDAATLTSDLTAWDPEKPIQPGDTVFAIEAAEWRVLPEDMVSDPTQSKSKQGWLLSRLWRQIRNGINKLWKSEGPQRLVAIAGVCTVALFSISTLLFWFALPDHEPWDGFYTTAILFLGGFGDVFGGLEPESPFPWWLRLFSFLLTLTGIALVGLLYGLITEKLLSIQFELLQRRPPVPQRNHIVIVGLGGIGRKVANSLQLLHLPLVAITNQELDPHLLPLAPMVKG